MRYLIVPALIFLAQIPGAAVAACDGGSMVKGRDALVSVLQGKTVCASRGKDRWQEFHQAGGALIDYKKGPNDRIDPTKRVGTWTVTGNSNGTRVNYDYGPGLRYSYSVHANAGGTYSMCDGGAEQVVSFSAGQVPCP